MKLLSIKDIQTSHLEKWMGFVLMVSLQLRIK